MAYIYGASTYATLNGDTAKKYEVRVGYEGLAYSIADNSTPVNLIMQVRTIDTAYNTWGFTQTSKLGSVQLEGKTFSVKVKNTWVTFATTTITVAHNDDGTFSGTISGSFITNSTATSSLKSGSASVVMTLPTIPRATLPTISSNSITMGTSSTITLAPASQAFKHKLNYTFGGVSSIVDGLSISGGFSASGNTTVEFIPPTTLGSHIPTTMSGVAILYCTTYDADGNQIGDAKTIELTLNIPSYVPIVSVSIAGNELLSGDYVQGKSSATVTINASGKHGSTIKSYSTVVDGATYSSNNFVTSNFSDGIKTFVVKVVDTRGQEVINDSNSVTVYPYTIPSINEFTAIRADDETKVSAQMNGSIAKVNGKNTSLFTIELNGITKNVTGGEAVIFTGLDIDKTYDAIARITDSYITVSRVISISTTDVTMDFNASGKGIAFGKVSEKDAFEVDMKTEFLNDVSIKGLTASWDELNYSKGLTANIQEQINSHGHSYMATKPVSIELEGSSSHGGFIDFHYAKSSADNTSRIIESASGTISVNGVDLSKGSTVQASTIYKGSNTYPVLGCRVLYSNESGNAGTITLSESASNFAYIIIIVGFTDTGASGSLVVHEPNGKTVDATIGVVSTDVASVGRVRYVISETTMTASNNYTAKMKANYYVATQNIVYCKTVLGFK